MVGAGELHQVPAHPFGGRVAGVGGHAGPEAGGQVIKGGGFGFHDTRMARNDTGRIVQGGVIYT